VRHRSGFALFAGAVLALAASAAAGPAVSDTLVNGKFSSALTKGWQKEARDLVGYHNVALLKDGGVRVAKEMCGRVRLFQEVKLTDLNQEFKTRARFTARVTKPGYYAYSAVVLEFLDSAGVVLGETRFVQLAGSFPLKSSDRLHLVRLAKAGTWQDLSLNIGDELKTHLAAVSRSKVRRLRIALESFASGRDAC